MLRTEKIWAPSRITQTMECLATTIPTKTRKATGNPLSWSSSTGPRTGLSSKSGARRGQRILSTINMTRRAASILSWWLTNDGRPFSLAHSFACYPPMRSHPYHLDINIIRLSNPTEWTPCSSSGVRIPAVEEKKNARCRRVVSRSRSSGYVEIPHGSHQRGLPFHALTLLYFRHSLFLLWQLVST